MSIAIFPGSYDPITNGHISVAKKAAEMFDKVYVAVMTNTSKSYMFSAQKRREFAQDALKNIANIEVIERPEELTVNVARDLGANAIIRGVRNSNDFLYEQQIAGMNEKLDPQIHTILVFTDSDQSFVASSMVKEVAKFGGEVADFLPKKAAEALTQRMRDADE